MAKKPHSDRNFKSGKYKSSGHLALLKGAMTPPVNIVKSTDTDDKKSA